MTVGVETVAAAQTSARGGGASSRLRAAAPARRRLAASSVRLLVAAHVRVYRDAVAHALAAEDGIEVIGTVGDRRELLARVRDVEPDLVLLDPGFPDGLATIRELHATRRAVKVVALVVLESEADVIALAEAGVSGFVTYDDSLTDLVNALRSVLDGDLICSPRTAGLLLSRVGVLAAERSDGPAAVGLTAREQDVVELLADGLSNKQIAARLSIELPTVKQHVHHILQKLGVARRGEAVAHLRRRGLLEGARPG